METKKLKVIAEGMGYKTAHIHKGRLFYDGSFDMPIEYEPDTTNNDQMVEIMEKFEWIGFERPMGHGFVICEYRVSLMDDYAKTAKGKTINEAVCNAAYEYFK